MNAQILQFPLDQSVKICECCNQPRRLRSTTEIWNDLRNFPMIGGDPEYRADLIRELQEQGVTFIEKKKPRRWWQFWRKDGR